MDPLKPIAIIAAVDPGAELYAAKKAALAMAAQQQVSVEFDFNGKTYRAEYSDLLKCIKSKD
jgi:hypothetical protein